MKPRLLRHPPGIPPMMVEKPTIIPGNRLPDRQGNP